MKFNFENISKRAANFFLLLVIVVLVLTILSLVLIANEIFLFIPFIPRPWSLVFGVGLYWLLKYFFLDYITDIKVAAKAEINRLENLSGFVGGESNEK